MKGFIDGDTRAQITLLPDRLDEYVADTNPGVVIDAVAYELDLGVLGFVKRRSCSHGQASPEPQKTALDGWVPVSLVPILFGAIIGIFHAIHQGR